MVSPPLVVSRQNEPEKGKTYVPISVPPIFKVVPAAPVHIHHYHKPDKSNVEVPAGGGKVTSGPLEEKPAKPEETTSIQKKKLPDPEEKTSKSGKTKKLKVYNGEGGRIHTEKQIEEILDWYLQTGELPDYVSERQRWSYRHHRTLSERRKLLEQQGIPIVVHEIGRHEANVIPISGSGAKRGKRASR